MKKVRDQERAIRDIIKKYGETINLRKSPYLIAEIVRNYSHIFGSTNGPLAGEPPPGTPPVPGSLPQFSPKEIFEEIARIGVNVRKLSSKIDKLL